MTSQWVVSAVLIVAIWWFELCSFHSLQVSLQDLRLANNQLQSDYEKLKVDESERERRIKELSGFSEKQAKSDLNGLLSFFTGYLIDMSVLMEEVDAA